MDGVLGIVDVLDQLLGDGATQVIRIVDVLRIGEIDLPPLAATADDTWGDHRRLLGWAEQPQWVRSCCEVIAGQE